MLAIIEDVSERRRLEDIRRDFIANVRHELKTPMGALGLLAETLQFEKDPAVAHRLAERINSEAFRVNRIIEDLLDLSRIEGEGSPTREPIPVSLIVADAIERIRTAAEQHDVKIDFDEPEANLVVVGDRRQLISAIHALLENAVVYSPTGGIVTITVDRVDADASTTTARPSAPSCGSRSRDQGVGHPGEGPRAHLRALLPRRPGPRARDRRHGTRTQHRAPRRPESRRHTSSSSRARAKVRRSPSNCR